MVYLIHFDTKYHHAQHYIGYVANPRNLKRRLQHHRNGSGARLMQVVTANEIGWKIVRTWKDGDRALERKLKDWHKASQLCPVCRKEKSNASKRN